MNTVSEKEMLPCVCGGKARYRYRLPLHWVECRNKRCPYKMRTRYCADGDEQLDPKSTAMVVDEWNRMVTRNG